MVTGQIQGTSRRLCRRDKAGEGVINIIDFLEVYKDFYEIGGKMADIHRKLKGAVAVVAVQKNLDAMRAWADGAV